MRGVLGEGQGQGVVVRITPACAGKTATRLLRQRKTQDHPRVCGEYPDVNQNADAWKGSPPQMRGILRDRDVLSPISGITPARAGNTADGHTVGVVGCGSPPHVRGIRSHCNGHVNNLGITPAFAGSIRHNGMPSRQRLDHPCLCGEYHVAYLTPYVTHGSPLLVRGILFQASTGGC